MPKPHLFQFMANTGMVSVRYEKEEVIHCESCKQSSTRAASVSFRLRDEVQVLTGEIADGFNDMLQDLASRAGMRLPEIG